MRHVSVIIAAFNGAATIGRAVRSALEQPETAEVLLVDDASSDGTGSVARAAAEGSDRLTVVVLPENRGPSAPATWPWIVPQEHTDRNSRRGRLDGGGADRPSPRRRR